MQVGWVPYCNGFSLFDMCDSATLSWVCLLLVTSLLSVCYISVFLLHSILKNVHDAAEGFVWVLCKGSNYLFTVEWLERNDRGKVSISHPQLPGSVTYNA